MGHKKKKLQPRGDAAKKGAPKDENSASAPDSLHLEVEELWSAFTTEERTEGFAITYREHAEARHQGKGEAVFDFGDLLRSHLVHVEVRRDPEHANLGTELALRCECAAFSVRARCKHAWAAILLQDLEQRAPRGKTPFDRIYLPKYRAERAERLAELRAISERPAAPALRSVAEWASSWRRLASRHGCGSSPIELRYAVVGSGPELAVFPLARLRDGSLGWRALARLPTRTWSDLALEDRRLLMLLFGGEEAICDADLSTLSEEVALPVETQELVLSELARSGRAHWIGTGASAPSRDVRALARAHLADAILPRVASAPLLHLAAEPVQRFGLEIEAGGDGSYALRARAASQATDDHAEDSANAVRLARISDTGALGFCDVGPALPLALSELWDAELRVSSSELETLLEAIGRLGMESRVRFAEIAGAAACVPVLRLEVAKEGRAKSFRCALAFDYGEGLELEPGAARGLMRSARGWLRRDTARESEARRVLAEVGVAEEKGEERWPLESFSRGVHALLERGWRVLAEGKPLRTSATSSWKLRSGTDWFELQGEVRFGAQVLHLPEVLANLKSGERFVQLGDGTLGVLPERWFASWAEWLELGTVVGEKLRFANVQSWILDALLSAAPAPIEVDAEMTRLREKIARFERVEPLAPPDGFRGELRAYQREGLGWLAFLREIGFGGCLADDMGLGKTVQVLAHLLARRKRAQQRPALIVVPRSLLFNWQREAARFAPELRVLDFAGPQRWKELGVGEDASAGELSSAFAQHDLVLTTYGTLRRDILKLRELCFDVAVLDEAQAIKNAESQSAKAARLLVADQRLALSGTPIENHLDELWSLFEFLNPGMLGRHAKFQALLAGGRGAEVRAGAELRRILRPFLLRRTKAEVLTELPPKTEQVLEVELEGEQRGYYESLRKTVREHLLERLDAEGLEKSQIHVLQALLRLRQAACHAGLANPKLESAPSAKLEALLPRLMELRENGHKALVFSQFTSFLGLLKPQLDANGIDYEYLDGRTKKREEKVQRFQENATCTAFLISLKAGGHGLNLTAADYVFLLDPWWNPAVEAQAIDRAHRMGQASKVFAYRVIARGTIEEKVLALQQRKRELAASIFEDESASLRDLTREDLEQLLAP
ncbi:MAG: DEAD/DEAH box helicase [Planctomycetes bacterium]|nr:DEAD/DEAH box helicase [Planctomycetota bacterium]